MGTHLSVHAYARAQMYVHKAHVNTHMHAQMLTYIHTWFLNTEGEEDMQLP